MLHPANHLVVVHSDTSDDNVAGEDAGADITESTSTAVPASQTDWNGLTT
jgi:hypothetical protein